MTDTASLDDLLISRGNLKNMAWPMPRMNRAVPYLGYIAVSGVKPDRRADAVDRTAEVEA